MDGLTPPGADDAAGSNGPSPDPRLDQDPDAATPTAATATTAAAGTVQKGPRLSLRVRLRWLLVVAGALLGAMSILCALVFVELIDARHNLVQRTDPASLAADKMLLGLVDQETGIRGYVLSGDRAFLQPQAQGLGEERDAQAQLDRDLAGDSHLLTLLAAADRAATAWQIKIANPAIAGVTPNVPPASATKQSLLAGKAAFDAIRSRFTALNQGLAEARASESRTLDSATLALVSSLLATLVAAVVVALGLVVGLRRWVTEPIGALGGDVRLVAAGGIDHPVAPVGPPEIRELATDIEAMRVRIGAELEAVDQARAELAARNADLARSNQDLEQFAYVASHDLQEPLRKVTSFVQLLQQRYEGQLDDRADSYIAFAVDGAKRMQALIQDLLAFSRVGRTSTQITTVDLVASLDAALRSLASAIEDSGGIIRTGALPTVEGNPALLTALWQNLIGNCLKFRADETPVVAVDAARQDSMWRISVADNGIGIDPRFADKVFVIFQRLHSREAYEGTGIGLALCRKIVEFHGGEIWLDPEYRPGTRIWFTLPVRAEDSTPADESDPGVGPAAVAPVEPDRPTDRTGPADAAASIAPPARAEPVGGPRQTQRPEEGHG